MLSREASIEIELKNGETFAIPVKGEAYEHILEAAVADRRELFVGSKEIFAAWNSSIRWRKNFQKFRLKYTTKKDFDTIGLCSNNSY